MLRPKPNSKAMEEALEAHAAGGPGILKPLLYIHSEREASARRQGYASWDEKAEAQAIQTWEWWKRFMGDEIE